MPTYTKINPVLFRYITRCIIWFGLITVLVTGYFFVNKFKKLSEGFISTQAQITDIKTYENVRTNRYATLDIITISFYREKGDYNPFTYIHVHQDRFGGYKPGEVGDYIPILYNAKNPNIMFINRFGYLWGWFIIIGFIGLIFTFLGLWLHRNVN